MNEFNTANLSEAMARQFQDLMKVTQERDALMQRLQKLIIQVDTLASDVQALKLEKELATKHREALKELIAEYETLGEEAYSAIRVVDTGEGEPHVWLSVDWQDDRRILRGRGRTIAEQFERHEEPVHVS